MVLDYTFPTDEYLLLGKIIKAQGLRGEVKVFLYSGQPENVADYKELHLVNSEGIISSPLTVLKCRVHGKAVIVQLATMTNRTDAERVEGYGVLLAKNLLPEASENEFYWHHYQDKLVIDIEGNTIGRVDHLFTNGAQAILVIKAGNNEILIPVIKSIIVSETVEELIINPPPGLIELNYSSSN